MVQEGPGKRGSRIINTNYPVTEGLILGTTKLKQEPNTPEISDITKEEGKLR